MKKTGFDAFFENITHSQEFHTSLLRNQERLGISSLELRSKIEDELRLNSAVNSSIFPSNKPTDIDGMQQNQVAVKKKKEKNETTTIQIERFEVKNPLTHGFQGVAGMENLKQELLDGFVQPLRFYFRLLALRKKQVAQESTESDLKDLAFYEALYQTYESYKVSIPTGLLFYGPPGTGKTYIAKKLAEELGAGFVAKSMGEFGSSYVHQTSKNVHEFFEAAKKASQDEPLMLFLDEIDSLVSKRTGNVDAQKAEEVSQFLQEFNALESAPNLLVVAATNKPDHLDTAILRSGRFDKKYYIGPPDFAARKELFLIHIEKKGRPHEVLDFDELSRLTDGYVASDIESICDEAARDASKSLLEFAKKFESSGNVAESGFSPDSITVEKISMNLLTEAIAHTKSSLRNEDVHTIQLWESSLGG